jgi:hypothetical protein
VIESPPADKEGQLAWVARRTVEELAAAGAPLDVDDICRGIVSTYAHYNLEPELLERLRVYVARWVERAGTRAPSPRLVRRPTLPPRRRGR